MQQPKWGSPSRFINQPRSLRQRLWPHHNYCSFGSVYVRPQQWGEVLAELRVSGTARADGRQWTGAVVRRRRLGHGRGRGRRPGQGERRSAGWRVTATLTPKTDSENSLGSSQVIIISLPVTVTLACATYRVLISYAGHGGSAMTAAAASAEIQALQTRGAGPSTRDITRTGARGGPLGRA